MSDLVPSENVEVSIAVPEMFYQQMQGLAELLNMAVADDALYQQGVDALALIHEQMTHVVETAAAALEAAIDARDDALSDLEDAIAEKESAEEELAELDRAIDDYWLTDNRKIQRLVEQIEEGVGESLYDSFWDDWDSTTKDQMADYIKDLAGVNSMEAYAFACALMDGDVEYDKGVVQKVIAALHAKLNQADNG